MTSTTTPFEIRREECCSATVYRVSPNPFTLGGSIGRLRRRSLARYRRSLRETTLPWLSQFLKETSHEPSLSPKVSWLRDVLEGPTWWAKSFDDLAVCPLRAFFSIEGAKGSIPYKLGGMEFQKGIIEILNVVADELNAKAYADPGERGLRTGKEGLKICARYKDVFICGRPDTVMIVPSPLTTFVVEVQQTGHLKASLKKTIVRLNFYAQGVHELYGLPVSLAVVTPEEAAWVIFHENLIDDALEELLRVRDFNYAQKKAKGKREYCESCAYRNLCWVSRSYD